MILEKYLSEKYPLYELKKFPMKTPSDPYTKKQLTDFDASFLLEPLKHKPDLSRLGNKRFSFSLKKDKYDKKMSSIFILAEAKHFLNRNKIAVKLWQFDRICEIFKLAKLYKTDREKYDTLVIDKSFALTSERNAYLSEIDSWILFFGACFWEKNLFDILGSDIAEYKNLAYNFKNASGDEKIHIYEKICEIERKWYEPGNEPETHRMTKEQILELDTIENALAFVKFIQPSGDRYVIRDKKEPVGMSSIPLHGGNRTRKSSKSKDDL
jgi:hypothetical protein